MPATAGSARRAARIVRPATARARARNQRIRALIRPDTEGELPFFCECGIEGCVKSVWLTLQAAAEAIDGDRLIIAPHVLREIEARLGRSAG